MSLSTFNHCPKFDQCSAPICPLDAAWRKRVMLRDESVCSYLLEYARENRPNFEGGREGYIAKAVGRHYLDMVSRLYPLRKAVLRASKRPVLAGGMPHA